MKYVICTTARSGSNLVCSYLGNAGVLGRPAEMLNPEVVKNGVYGKRFAASYAVDVEQYLHWLVEQFSTSNGVFGIKLLYEDLEFLGGFRPVQDLITGSCVLFLRRRSKVKQAVSYYLARETGKWVHTDAGRRRPDEVPYDFAKISKHYAMLLRQEAAWVTYFEKFGVPYFEVVFEDFLLDVPEGLRSICRRLTVDAGKLVVRSDLREQSTDVNKAFSARFASEYFRFSEPDQGQVVYGRQTFVGPVVE